MTRILTERDRKFLARHRALGREQSDDDVRGTVETVEISGQVVGDPTDKAFRLFDGVRTEWLPISQVTDNGDGTFSMPEWLAKKKGFI